MFEHILCINDIEMVLFGDYIQSLISTSEESSIIHQNNFIQMIFKYFHRKETFSNFQRTEYDSSFIIFCPQMFVVTKMENLSFLRQFINIEGRESAQNGNPIVKHLASCIII